MRSNISIVFLIFCVAATMCQAQSVTNCATYSNNRCATCDFGYVLDYSVNGCFVPCSITQAIYDGQCQSASAFNTGCAAGVWVWPAGYFECFACQGAYILVPNGQVTLCIPVDNYIAQNTTKYCSGLCTTR